MGKRQIYNDNTTNIKQQTYTRNYENASWTVT